MHRQLVISLLAVTVVACAASENALNPSKAQTERPLAISVEDPALAWGACPEIFPAGCAVAILRGDPAEPDADVLLRMPGGYEIPPHWHTSSERMILVSGEFKVRYKGQEEVTLNAGDYAYGPAKLPHSAACVSDEQCILFIAFQSAVDAHPHEGSL